MKTWTFGHDHQVGPHKHSSAVRGSGFLGLVKCEASVIIARYSNPKKIEKIRKVKLSRRILFSHLLGDYSLYSHL